MLKDAGEGIKSAINGNYYPLTIIKGILISYVITVPTFMIFAYILTNTNFPEKYISPAVIITTVISILVAGSAVTRNARSKGWLNGAIVGLVYMLVLYITSSLVFMDFSVNGYVVTIMLLGALAGTIGGIVGINLKKGPNTKRKK